MLFFRETIRNLYCIVLNEVVRCADDNTVYCSNDCFYDIAAPESAKTLLQELSDNQTNDNTDKCNLFLMQKCSIFHLSD